MDINLWREHLRADGYSPNTIHARVTVVLIFASAAGVAPHLLTPVHVRGYFGTRDLEANTRLAYLSHLTSWGEWIGRPLTAGIRRPRRRKGLPRPISERALDRLVGHAQPCTRERAWLLLGAYSGLRSCESGTITAEDIERSSLRVLGKGDKLGVAPAPQIVRDELTLWCDRTASGPLWPGSSPTIVRAALYRLGERSRVKFGSHQLRHRFGTQYYIASGRDLLATQRAMRHSSPAETAIYAQIADEHVLDVAELLPGAVARPLTLW